ncbi:MAG: hypothetical protein ACREDL_21180, partial [Bradyrhizobium sp.]
MTDALIAFEEVEATAVIGLVAKLLWKGARASREFRRGIEVCHECKVAIGSPAPARATRIFSSAGVGTRRLPVYRWRCHQNDWFVVLRHEFKLPLPSLASPCEYTGYFLSLLHRVFDEVLENEGCPRLDQAAAF